MIVPREDVRLEEKDEPVSRLPQDRRHRPQVAPPSLVDEQRLLCGEGRQLVLDLRPERRQRPEIPLDPELVAARRPRQMEFDGVDDGGVADLGDGMSLLDSAHVPETRLNVSTISRSPSG